MFEAYQNPRSVYYIIEHENKILGGAGISELKETIVIYVSFKKCIFISLFVEKVLEIE